MTRRKGHGTKSQPEKKQYVEKVVHSPAQPTTTCSTSKGDLPESTVTEAPRIRSSYDPYCNPTSDGKSRVRPIPLGQRLTDWMQQHLISLIIVPTFVGLFCWGLAEFHGYVKENAKFKVEIKKDLATIEKDTDDFKKDFKEYRRVNDSFASQLMEKFYEIKAKVQSTSDALDRYQSQLSINKAPQNRKPE